MTLSKTWTLPTGEVLTVVPGQPDRYGMPQGTTSKYTKVAVNGTGDHTVRAAMAEVESSQRAEQRRREQAEIVKALKGKRPPKPKRPEPMTAPEGSTLYFMGGRDDEPVVSVTSVSDTGSTKQVYYATKRSRMMSQASMKNFGLFTPEESAALAEAKRVRDEHGEDLKNYPRGYSLALNADSVGDIVAVWVDGKGTKQTRTYVTGFFDSQDPTDPEVVVEIKGIVYRVETNNQVGAYSQDFIVPLAADLGLVRPDRLGFRLPYEYVPVDDLANWEALMGVYSQANEHVSTLIREAQGRAGELLLAYEKTFVAWKDDVEDWEREWKS